MSCRIHISRYPSYVNQNIGAFLQNYQKNFSTRISQLKVVPQNTVISFKKSNNIHAVRNRKDILEGGIIEGIVETLQFFFFGIWTSANRPLLPQHRILDELKIISPYLAYVEFGQNLSTILKNISLHRIYCRDLNTVRFGVSC